MNKALKLKRIYAAGLIVLLITGSLLAGCKAPEASESLTAPLRIGTLNGPTGIGMIQLMEQPDSYEVTTFQSPEEVVGKIITGELDIAAVPSNLAAVLYNKTEGGIVLLGTNTLGVLYILENGDSFSSLKDLRGKTIIASGKGGSPEFILNQLLLTAGLDPNKDVTINWMMNHTDVASTLMVTKGAVAMLPQPFTTIATTKNAAVRVAVDLNKEWQDSQQAALPMGVLIAQKGLVEDRESDVTIFLNAYKKSVAFVNSDPAAAAALVSKYGIISDQAIAEKAIPFCNIVYMTAQESKSDLNRFYEIISQMDPKSVGGTIPDDNFYYSESK